MGVVAPGKKNTTVTHLFTGIPEKEQYILSYGK